MMHEAASIGTRTIISLGGSLIVPNEIDTVFLRSFREVIASRVAQGDSFVIITGGGKTARVYQSGVRGVGIDEALQSDWIGIHATRINGELMRIIMGDLAHERIIINPAEIEPTTKPVMVGAGYLPGHSSDVDAIEVARAIGAKRVINLTNIDRVYDHDPKTHPDAKPVDAISWTDYRAIIPTDWTPGLNTPFDPIASAEAQELGIEVIIANGAHIENLKNILEGKEFVGTKIS